MAEIRASRRLTSGSTVTAFPPLRGYKSARVPGVSDPMNMKLVRTLGVFLSASLLSNAYLYMEMSRFKEAWLTQFIATSKVDSILKASSADLSFDNIKQISISAFGKESVHIVNLENEFTEYGSDRLALGVNDTLLLFKNGFYHGSKANLPNH